nr:hypothetical protein BaRGS_019164 [Batillaria attramentaria]
MFGLSRDSNPRPEHCLEVDLRDLQEGIGSAQTLCLVGWERLKVIRDKRVAALNLKDEQQFALIDLFKGEIKDLQHRADAALSTTAGAKSRALGTADEIAALGSTLQGVSDTNDEQADRIGNLTDSIAAYKEDIIGQINSRITYLEGNLYDVQDKVDDVHEYVESRKCEYGFIGVNLNGQYTNRRVQFKTVFSSIPTVTISLAGFSAHLDVHKYGEPEYDVLGIDKYVSTENVDETGFTAHPVDKSTGQVELKTVYCKWMACENIDGELTLPPHP